MARFFAIVISTTLMTSFAIGQESAAPVSPPASATLELTEAQAVKLALNRPQWHSLEQAERELEQGHGQLASRYANPEISYVREQTFGRTDSGEDSLVLSQTIDVGNRLGLRSDAGALRARAADQRSQARHAQLALEVRKAFYEALHRDQREQAQQVFLQQLQAALDAVAKRQAGGDVATFEHKRLLREQLAAATQQKLERSAKDRALLRLSQLVGSPLTEITLKGELLPPSAPLSAKSPAPQRPEVVASLLTEEAARLEEDAAARWWVPDLTLQFGYKGVDAGPDRVDGFIAGASLALPLWNQELGAQKVARAEALREQAHRGLAGQALAAERAGLERLAPAKQQAAEQQSQQGAALAQDLNRMALAGYAAGELPLYELLDVQRSTTADALAASDLAFEARALQLQLDFVRGAP